jgi:hypothetical protein
MCREDGTLLGVLSVKETLQKRSTIIYTDIIQPRRSREAREVMETEADCPIVVTGTAVARPDWVLNEHFRTLNTLEIIQVNEHLDTMRYQLDSRILHEVTYRRNPNRIYGGFN